MPNKIMMKKYARKVLAATMAVSMMVPMMGMNVFAADENTTNGTTNVKYVVQESYTWSVPTEITFTSANTEITTSGTTGVTQNVQVTKNIIPNKKKLVISVTNNDYKIQTNDGASLNYKVSVKGTGDQYNELTSAKKDVLSVDAGTNTGSATLKFVLTKDSVEKAGTYTGTVSYTSALADK